MPPSKHWRPARNQVLLELHIPDFWIAKDFYSKLGFEVVWERQPQGFKGYLVMRKDDNILCFWWGNEHIIDHEYFRQWDKSTKRGFGVEIVIVVDNLESFYEQTSAFATVVEELQVRPWWLRDFRIEDPFGFYLRISESHNILSPENAVE